MFSKCWRKREKEKNQRSLQYSFDLSKTKNSIISTTIHAIKGSNLGGKDQKDIFESFSHINI